MRTLAFLAALFLLALLAQAEPLPENAEDTPEEQQPEGKDQDVAVSFAGAERSALPYAGRTSIRLCFCRSRCGFLERRSGTCFLGGKVYSFCCL